MKTKKIHVFFLFFIIPALFFSSCITTHQEYYINKDGSGKVKVQAQMPLDMNLSMGNKREEGATSYEDSVKMIKKVQDIISNSEGIEAWKDITYFIDDQGMLNFSATAFFPVVQKVEFAEIPVLPVSTFTDDEITWMSSNKLAGTMNKKREMPRMKIDDENLDETVNKIQHQFRQSKMMLGMMLNSFQIEATYHLPYKIKNHANLDKIGDYTVRQRLNGEKIFENYEKLIENEEKLKDLIKKENIKEFSLENPKLFQAAFPEGSVYRVNFRTGLFSPGPKNYFPYQQEIETIQNKKPELSIPKPSKAEPVKIQTESPAGYKPYWGKNSSNYNGNLYNNKLAIYERGDQNRIQIFDIQEKEFLNEIKTGKNKTFNVNLYWDLSGEKITLLSHVRNKDNKGLLEVFHSDTQELLAKKSFIAQPSDFAWIDNNHFAISFMNNDLYFGRIENHEVILSNKLQLNDQPIASGAVNPSKITVLRMENKKELYVLSYDSKSSSLKIWDPKKVERLRTLKLEESGVPYELIASPNPKYVALLLHNRIVTFQNGKIFKEINDLDQPLYQISWNPDGSKIAYINKNNELVYYHIQTGLKKVIVNPDKNLQRLIKLNLSGQYGLTQIAGSSFKYDIIELEY